MKEVEFMTSNVMEEINRDVWLLQRYYPYYLFDQKNNITIGELQSSMMSRVQPYLMAAKNEYKKTVNPNALRVIYDSQRLILADNLHLIPRIDSLQPSFLNPTIDLSRIDINNKYFHIYPGPQIGSVIIYLLGLKVLLKIHPYLKFILHVDSNFLECLSFFKSKGLDITLKSNSKKYIVHPNFRMSNGSLENIYYIVTKYLDQDLNSEIKQNAKLAFDNLSNIQYISEILKAVPDEFIYLNLGEAKDTKNNQIVADAPYRGTSEAFYDRLRRTTPPTIRLIQEVIDQSSPSVWTSPMSFQENSSKCSYVYEQIKSISKSEESAEFNITFALAFSSSKIIANATGGGYIAWLCGRSLIWVDIIESLSPMSYNRLKINGDIFIHRLDANKDNALRFWISDHVHSGNTFFNPLACPENIISQSYVKEFLEPQDIQDSSKFSFKSNLAKNV